MAEGQDNGVAIFKESMVNDSKFSVMDSLRFSTEFMSTNVNFVGDLKIRTVIAGMVKI